MLLILFSSANYSTQAEAPTDNVSHWRGPLGNGISTSLGVPTTWSESENLRWQTAMPGPSNATPSISGNLLFTTSLLDGEYLLGAYSKVDGSLVWNRTITTLDNDSQHKASRYTLPSVVSNQDYVVAVTDQGKFTCYRLTGEPTWKLDLSERINRLSEREQYSSTPLIHAGHLYFQWIHGDGDPRTQESMVGCINIEQGAIAWKTMRSTGARNACEQSYASPILIKSGKQSVVISHGADYAIANRAVDGQEVWRIGGLNPMSNYRSGSPFVASPVVSDGLLILPAAKNGVVIGLDLTGRRNSEEGSINRSGSGLIGWGPQQWKNLSGKPKRLWRLSGGAPGAASPLLHDGLLYLCSESGELTCYDAITSERIYRYQLPRGYYHASPILAEDKIYLTSYSGTSTAIAAGEEFRILAQNKLPGPIVSSPIIDRGVIYMRSYTKLYAIGSNKSRPVAELSAATR